LKVVSTFPRPVREVETLWIELSDGCRLAACMWLPEDAQSHPVPAILECLPYRRRDGTAWRDAEMHPYVAGHGYACLRIDLRGSGDSDGILDDEYSRREQDDLVEAIAWVARQSWCSGAVGMTGISWGGFNALQVAARRPPALKAIITLCAADDRYADDIHYMGGAMLHDNFAWASAMYAYLSMPPDPAVVGGRWRQTWLDRLRAQRFLLRPWLLHQRRDGYWKHGSVCESYGDIACAVYAIGGWEDGYSNAVPRLLAGLQCPAKGLIGPWGHAFPHRAYPGPSIGYLQEALRWWDHWLQGSDTGIMDEPRYRVWMNDSYRPAAVAELRPGRWVAEPSWPSANETPRRWYLNENGLGELAETGSPRIHRSPEETGSCTLEWCSYGGTGGDFAPDQRPDDGRSLCFDSEPLPARLEILGTPVVQLDLSIDQPVAKLAVRLCDVWPDGESTKVTYTLFNLTHRESHEHPSPLERGRLYRVRIAMNHIAHAFLPGHRLRVAISTSYWPQMWPASAPVTLTLQAGTGHLELPVRGPRVEDVQLAPFGAPAGAPPLADRELRAGGTRRTVTTDISSGTTTVVMDKDSGGALIEAIGLAVDSASRETYRITAGDPLSAEGEIVYRQSISRGDWQVRTETRTTLMLTATAFVAAAEIDAYEGERRVFSSGERFSIPRDLN
jgi:putative CocE/NonD family hydrolase